MFANLSPEAKIAIIVSTVIGSFLIGPIVAGVIVLLAAGVTYAPWPNVAFICTLLVVIWSWQVLWGRFKSHFLFAVDIIILILTLLSFIPNPMTSDPLRAAFNTAIVTYIVAILMIVFHSFLALFVALGINPRVQTEVSRGQKALA